MYLGDYSIQQIYIYKKKHLQTGHTINMKKKSFLENKI